MVPTFSGSVWKIPVGDNAFLSPELEFNSTTSIDENFLQIDFQTNQNYWVDLKQMYMVSKLKFVKSHEYETYNSKERKIEHKEEAKADEGTLAAEEEQEPPFPLVTYVNNKFHSIFSNVEVYVNNQHKYNSNGLYAQKFYISNNFKALSLNTKEFCTARGTTRKSFLLKLWKRFYGNRFTKRESKCLADLMTSCCRIN